MSENCGQGLMGALSQYWSVEPKARLQKILILKTIKSVILMLLK